MRVLVLNVGSSTLKWTLLDGGERTTIRSGAQEWGSVDADRRARLIRASLREAGGFDAVGHRIVHGGTRFGEPVLIDRETRAALEALLELDALHMRPALAGIDAVASEHPHMPQVAAFDTSLHAHLPEAAAGYALPFEWSERWGLRRFGFHGLSIAHSLERARVLLGGTPRRMIVCHLGSGCSVTALQDGRSIDTTMGFTPLEGLMMGTRSGSIDPGLMLHLQLRCGVSVGELSDTLQQRSGLLGVSGVSADLRQVQAAADAGSARARLAVERFVLGLRRAVGAMVGVLEGLDAIVFTGGIGENSERIRAEIAAGLGFLGLRLDARANAAAAGDRIVSAGDTRISMLVIEAREDLVILEDVLRLTRG